MNLIVAFFVGLGVALASSVPVGPINFAIFQTTFTKGRKAALMIGIGGMIADTIYCFLGLWLSGLIAENQNPAIFKWLNVLTIPVVIFLGLMMIRNRNKEPDHRSEREGSRGGIIMGIMLGISNPVLFAYWLWVATIVLANGWIQPTFPYYLSFALGVAAGISAFFLIFIQIVAMTTKKMSTKFRSTFSMLIGIGFIAFGVYLTVRFLINEL